VAPTVLDLLAGPTPDCPLPALDERALPRALTQGARTVVLLVADGLGHLQLLREVAAGNAPTLARLLAMAARGDGCARYSAITSVFPTTTVAALGSLNSGEAPTGHGLLGYTLRLGEFGTVAEMVRWGPLGQRGSFSDPEHGGASPERFFWAESVYRRLQAAGVARTVAVNPSSFAGTALTRMLHQGAEYHGYVATSSVSVIVARLLREAARPGYIYAYWPTVDAVTHVLGPGSEEHGAEVAALDQGLRRLLERGPGDGDTLLLLTADHGHIDTSAEQQVLLNDYPDLLELLAAYPAGERRAVYLHAQPGQAAALEARARERLGGMAVVLSREEAVGLGLYGPGSLPTRAPARVGDVLLLPRGNLQFAFELPEGAGPAGAQPPKPPFCGLHGGLTPEEALVPLLAVRL
jgi:predicted AlkP superfamily pyrophosphatase or phosphodiesterase